MLNPGSNTPVLIGTLSSYRYGVDNYFSSARPWYDPTGVSGKRMWDELHPPLRKRPSMWRISATGVHPNPENADFGGPMRIVETYCPWHVVKGNTVVSDGDPGHLVQYSGGFVPTWFGNHPDPPDFSWGWNSNSNDAFGSAAQYGAEGWNKFKPTLQGVDLAAALYELQEFPEMLKTTSEGFHNLWKQIVGRRGRVDSPFMNPKNLANQFLNHQFGWAPFVKDLTDALTATSKMYNTFDRHKRENGRWIHRRGTVTRSLSSTTELFSDHYAYVAPDIAGLTRWDQAPDGNVTRGYSQFFHETEQKVTFSAEFRYWVPDLVHDEFSKAAHVRNLARYYGLRVSPSLIWKLTPWSWLGDWLLPVKQIYQSADPNDINLVARYAYVMSRIIKRTRHFATVHLLDGRNANMAWTKFLEVKSRAKASPFGFGLTANDLSSRQLAILSSLGITKSRIR